jgi:hypothetical protein
MIRVDENSGDEWDIECDVRQLDGLDFGERPG